MTVFKVFKTEGVSN